MSVIVRSNNAGNQLVPADMLETLRAQLADLANEIIAAQSAVSLVESNLGIAAPPSLTAEAHNMDNVDGLVRHLLGIARDVRARLDYLVAAI